MTSDTPPLQIVRHGSCPTVSHVPNRKREEDVAVAQAARGEIEHKRRLTTSPRREEFSLSLSLLTCGASSLQREHPVLSRVKNCGYCAAASVEILPCYRFRRLPRSFLPVGFDPPKSVATFSNPTAPMVVLLLLGWWW